MFMQASIILAKMYGFQTIEYEEVEARTAAAGFQAVPFVNPLTYLGRTDAVPRLRAQPTFVIGPSYDFVDPNTKKTTTISHETALTYYVITGWRASQIICRNYLTYQYDKNQYLEFLRKELGYAANLASLSMSLANANDALLKAAANINGVVDNGFNAYIEYLAIDTDTARSVVEAAQNTYGRQFLLDIQSAASGKRLKEGVIFSFPEAINAVHTIETQCTKGVIKQLVNRAAVNSADMSINDLGILVFNKKAADKERKDATGAANEAKGAANQAKGAATKAEGAKNKAEEAADKAEEAAAKTKGDTAPSASQPAVGTKR
jgi:hypothetical protein